MNETLKDWLIRIAYLSLMILIIWWLLPPVTSSRAPSNRSICKNHLRQISIAIHNYHQQYDCLPPAYIADETGRPLHSWRVLLLPFVGQSELHSKYDFQEPWDGPNNRRLWDKIPDIYLCPSDRASNENKLTTNYVVVVGPNTVWPVNRATRLDDITDKHGVTLLVVEVADSGILWSEPRDLHLHSMAREVNSAAGFGICSGHTGGAHVAFADGSVRLLKDELHPETMLRLLEINDGKKVDEF